ncbi:hypothetical protein CH373_14255 [Leptospira perolatii]|uniref:histidine kinase n=1 Tax=Leptospira perolatii TaxID=2023191 RepID=A0A2M9ZKH2_9LEPT|nr:PAS domain-containing protein [Leptospira perolatii]PJZ68147.1 hypothetical protein CH360_17775 [Leptospira perolatii]PJZ72565.1 hypothetical protein CH373_14255 [Leptospira perolatii]
MIDSRLIKILFIEDDESEYNLIRSLFEGIGSVSANLIRIKSEDVNLSVLDKYEFDLILIDRRPESANIEDFLQDYQGEKPRIHIFTPDKNEAHIKKSERNRSEYLIKENLTSSLLEKSILHFMDRNGAEQGTEASDRMQKIIQFNLEIATNEFGFDELIDYIAQNIPKIINCDGVVIEIPEGDAFVSVAVAGNAIPLLGTHVSISNSLSGRAMLTKSTVYSPDTEKDPVGNLALCRQIDARSILISPLLYDRKCAGILNIISRKPFAFDESTLKTVELLSSMVGAVLFRRKMEEDLLKSRKLLEKAMKVAKLGSWQLSAKTGAMTWSEEVYEIFGISKDQFANTLSSFLDHVHPDDQEFVMTNLEKSYEEGLFAPFESRIVRADGSTKFVVITGEVAKDKSGNSLELVGTIQDITERKETEERLIQSNKMEAVGQLAGGMAHDFNNLLNVILANLDLLEMKLKDSPDTLKRVHSAQEAVQRGVEVNRRLLSFSRKQALNPQSFELNSLLKEFVPILNRIETASIHIEYDLEEIPLICEIERSGLENALLNLCLNSRDSITNQGKILISTRYLPNSNRSSQYRGLSLGDYCAITIYDNGHGMDDYTKARMFEPFFTTKGSVKGTGMGLPMVYGFVKQSKGIIQVQTQQGAGTSVTLFLPITSEGKSHLPDLKGEYDKFRILVLEADDIGTSVLSYYLEHLVHDIVFVTDESHAVKIVQEDKEISIVILESNAAKLSDINVASELSKRFPNKRIVLTYDWNVDEEAVRKNLEPGVLTLRKPYSWKKMQEILMTHLPLKTAD